MTWSLSSSFVATIEIGTLKLSRDHELPDSTKQPGAVRCDEMPQPARVKNDLKALFSVRMTLPLEPRTAATGLHGIAWCAGSKRLLAAHAM